MKSISSIICVLFCLFTAFSCPLKATTNIYLIPGQGADYRLFDSLELDDSFKINHIEYFTPERRMTMNDFARALSEQIDTTEQFILVGVSLGGMLATEMSTFLNPLKVIIISSAKERSELPWRYRFQKTIPVFELFPPGLIKAGARFMQPIVEPNRKVNKSTFKSMLKAKDPKFLKRTIRMIVRWEMIKGEKEILHLHGTKDHTIPIRNINEPIIVNEGSHMMILTNFKKVNLILKEQLKNVC